MPNKCKFYKKMRTKGYNRCIRGNSIRKGCRRSCAFYEMKLSSKFKDWLEGKICDFTYWLEGVINGRR